MVTARHNWLFSSWRLRIREGNHKKWQTHLHRIKWNPCNLGSAYNAFTHPGIMTGAVCIYIESLMLSCYIVNQEEGFAMTREQLLDNTPPCGLMCYTCPGFKNGTIQEHSSALIRLREGYREFLDEKLPDEYRHILDEHDKYIEKLKKDSTPGCLGCRKTDGKGPGCIKDCFIPDCAKEHSVDFCGECGEFPCQRIDGSNIYGKEAKEGFYNGSLSIKEHGAETYFKNNKDVSHYIKYAK